ncbi:MAG TPA: hypothetical protein DDW76_13205 [Cyanobacteria bacterium UBA11369]|nr:hypothetical protein [Cyanobacteria bacterium UBA11371]HBE21603.1 hypothetical protein [Cyanobacteria bacterium UBA11367]HBE30042.1 hypothetical protein [Cyanobacteria bacterium UBA11368]HBE49715.1 hypothetical protein [Cyanobacteria bacterium UBA11369]
MLSPFPGMNPYLENPGLWSEVHNRLIVNLADSLAPVIPEEYRVSYRVCSKILGGEAFGDKI